jgi:hypothetical protein
MKTLVDKSPFFVYDEILYTSTWFYYGCSYDEVRKDILKQKNIDISVDNANNGNLGHCFSFDLDEGQNLYIVHVKRKRDYETLTHEIIHLIFRIFRDNKIPIDYKNQEIFARYHTFFLNKMKGKLR